jgi:hypothetical protein
MKRQNVNTIARKFFAGSMVAAVLFLSVQCKANNHSVNTTSVLENVDPITKPSVKYVGSKNDNLLFHVNFKNTNNEFYTVEVLDDENEVLYRLSAKDKEFNKTFELTSYTDINKLSFVIKSNKVNFKESFDINITTTSTSHVAVVMN